MKRFTLFVMLMFVSITIINAQGYKNTQWKKNRGKLIFGTGASNFLGELGGANRVGSNAVSIRDFDFASIRPNLHLGYRYQIHSNFALKANFNYAFIGGNDKLTKEEFRNNRNLNFRTAIYELSGQLEYFFNVGKKGRRYSYKGFRGGRGLSLQPYVFVGFGGFYFNPKGKYNGPDESFKDGEWHALHPLSTEGQGILPTREKYSLFQIVIPYGVGVRFPISRNWEMGIEYGIRMTFTDYIDDVSKTYVNRDYLLAEKGELAWAMADPSFGSADELDPLYRSSIQGQQRGDPRDNDTYMFALVTFYYTINKGFIPKLRF
jgi:hypothetical protein